MKRRRLVIGGAIAAAVVIVVAVALVIAWPWIRIYTNAAPLGVAHLAILQALAG